jgi:hypothetical protein
VEGLEADLIWCDELVPMDLLETLRYRLVTRAGKMIVSFTPIEGYSMTVKDMISGGEVTEWRDSELLPGKNLPSGPEGKMPYTMRCRRPRANAIWFHTKWNPYNPYEELKKRVYGLHDGEVMVRAYGWATATSGTLRRTSTRRRMRSACANSSMMATCAQYGSRRCRCRLTSVLYRQSLETSTLEGCTTR